jgi:hypothetical protein
VITRKFERRNSVSNIAALALAITSLVCNESWAQPVGENLVAAVPSGFKVGYQTGHDQMSMQEWVRESEPVANWTEMVTVQVFHANKSQTPHQFLQSIGMQWLQTCTGAVPNNIVNGQANGCPVLMLLLRCPLNPAAKKPEITAVRVIRGGNALYSVPKAFRFDPSNAQLAQAMLYLSNINICDTWQADHPCPKRQCT